MAPQQQHRAAGSALPSTMAPQQQHRAASNGLPSTQGPHQHNRQGPIPTTQAPLHH